jgi:hypothetical protein
VKEEIKTLNSRADIGRTHSTNLLTYRRPGGRKGHDGIVLIIDP